MTTCAFYRITELDRAPRVGRHLTVRDHMGTLRNDVGDLVDLRKASASQSLTRALDLLEVFLGGASEMNSGELAQAVGMSRSGVQRLLDTLEARRYLEHDRETRRYRLGVRVFDLGARFHNQLDIRRAALPEMTSLVEQTGQAAFLCVRDGDEALCLERVGGRHRVRIFALQLGERQPLHCGAAPRALLSGLADDEILAYARRTKLPRFTAKTITSADGLVADAHQTQRQGYVLSDQDVTAGIAAVGAPVHDHTGQVIASISVSGLAASYTSQRIDELAHGVRVSADRLSRQMGFSKES
jgi:DNA-binding IclR family transcriptional regulator